MILIFLSVSFGGMAAAGSGAVTGRHYDPLLQVLIRNGVITEQEAAVIQQEAGEIEKQQTEEIIKQVRKEVLPKPLRGLKFRMLSYIDYSAGATPQSNGGQKSYNRFAIKRGYFRVDKKRTSWLAGQEA